MHPTFSTGNPHCFFFWQESLSLVVNDAYSVEAKRWEFMTKAQHLSAPGCHHRISV